MLLGQTLLIRPVAFEPLSSAKALFILLSEVAQWAGPPLLMSC